MTTTMISREKAKTTKKHLTGRTIAGSESAANSGIRYRILDTESGPFAIVVRTNGDVQARWVDDDDDLLQVGVEDETLMPGLARKLESYFAGKAVDFSDVPTPAGSGFFAACWRACRRIPRGETISYGELAERAGSPAAARAAGQAMRNNPLPIVVPCHRVIGTNGELHGFGGTCDSGSPELARKRLLLELESKRSR